MNLTGMEATLKGIGAPGYDWDVYRDLDYVQNVCAPAFRQKQPKQFKPKFMDGSGKIMQNLHPGEVNRLMKSFDPKLPEQENQANARLLYHQNLLPHHMREQFMNSNQPAQGFVQRLRHLADVNPEFRKGAAPLLSDLQNLFLPPERTWRNS